MKQKTLSLTTDDTVTPDINDEQLLIYLRRQRSLRIVAIRSQLNRELASLSKIRPLAFATVCQGESAAAAQMGISQRRLRRTRTEVPVEFERQVLREFPSTASDRSAGWAGDQWNEMSRLGNKTKAGAT
jgi:hypothetical protein